MTREQLLEYCNTELDNIEKIIGEIFLIFSPDKSEYTIAERAAISAFVVNIYGGIEKILKQMLIFDKLDVQDSPEWHEKVLKKAGEMAILTPELFKIFSQYLSFRNHFLYTYISNIKWEDLTILIKSLKEVMEKFKSEVQEYIQTIEAQ
jgi:uncharacterized protein YutE (UPF0331/DUF86 family)